MGVVLIQDPGAGCEKSATHWSADILVCCATDMI
jgi:hypothetical protein